MSKSVQTAAALLTGAFVVVSLTACSGDGASFDSEQSPYRTKTGQIECPAPGVPEMVGGDMVICSYTKNGTKYNGPMTPLTRIPLPGMTND
jgi:hypothetical protein